ELPGRRPRLPHARRCLHRGADRDLHRLQTQERGGGGALAPASLRVRAVLRHLELWGSLSSCAPVVYRRSGRVNNPPQAASLPHIGTNARRHRATQHLTRRAAQARHCGRLDLAARHRGGPARPPRHPRRPAESRPDHCVGSGGRSCRARLPAVLRRHGREPDHARHRYPPHPHRRPVSRRRRANRDHPAPRPLLRPRYLRRIAQVGNLRSEGAAARFLLPALGHERFLRQRHGGRAGAPGRHDIARLPTGVTMLGPELMAPDLTLAPDPESVRHFLGRLRQDSPSAYQRLMTTPAALRCAVSLFSYSRFLSESVLRDPERLLRVAASRSFNSVLTLENYRERLYSFLGAGVPSAVDFARFRRRQLLRILLRDTSGAATLANVTEELSNLADAILDVAYRRIRAELVARHGEPRLEDGALCGFSVISLGKLGGKELNYSSDIDLMFVYGGNGETDGPAVLTNKEFYKKVANQYTALLSSYTAEGPL